MTQTIKKFSFLAPLLHYYRLFRTKIFLSFAGVLLCLNVFSSIKETVKMSQLRQRIPYSFLGDRFRGLDAVLGKAPFLGYYTDKNLDDNRSAMQFAQAQLVLAPAILDLNNTGHEFIIFDCTSPLIAMKKIQEIGAQPLKANPYGIILARNPQHAEKLLPSRTIKKLLNQRP